nr:VOC family protein [Octadecabacter algicola]
MQVPRLLSIDHLVLTVASIEQSVKFYEDVLCMAAEQFRVADGTVRTALKFGNQKINLHQAGAEFDPKAANPRRGSADICFLSDTPLVDWIAHLAHQDVSIEEGPIVRTGAVGPLESIYIRDLDGNLIEVSNPT